MTREEILAMAPGPELNKLVAERIMGECYHEYWKDGEDSVYCRKCGESRFYHQQSQAYSMEIEAAWRVAQMLGLAVVPLNNGDWMVCKANVIYSLRITDDHCQDHRLVICHTAPEALCKAGLITRLVKEARG